MPYIKSKEHREALRNGDTAQNAGELNYQLFYYVKHYNDTYHKKDFQFEEDIERFVKQFLGTNPNYQKYNDMRGCLISCYKEIERRLGIKVKDLLEIMNSYDEEIANYEDKKIIENSDVE